MNAKPKCLHADKVNIQIQGVYDGTCFYECPTCHERWHRFGPEETRLRARIEACLGQRLKDWEEIK